MTRSVLIGFGASAALVAASIASAGISGTSGGDSFGGAGWDVPPANLGGWIMTQYDNVDPLVPVGNQTDIAHSDIFSTHTTMFSVESSHFQVTNGWATWSGGYTGSVYYPNGDSSLTLTPSAGTVAYSLFFEPDAFEDHDFEVTAFDNLGGFATVNTVTNGNAGATWAGFWTDGATTITSIRIVTDAAFATGRFGYAVPAPGAIALLGLTGLVGARRRRA